MGRSLVRSFWQAYREQRLVLLVCMITVIFPVIIDWFFDASNGQTIFLALSCPMLFILTSCSMMLAGERDARTLDNLRLMRPSRVGFLAGKLLWVLLGTTSFTLASLAVWYFEVRAHHHGSEELRWSMIAGVVAVGWIEAMGWGLLATAYCRSVLISLVVSTTAVFVTGALVSQSLLTAEGFDVLRPSDLWQVPLIIRGVLALLVLVVGLRSVYQQLKLPAELSGSSRSFGRWRILTHSLFPPRHLAAILWQESRTQTWIWLPMLVPFAIGSLLTSIDGSAKVLLGWLVFVVPLILASGMLGVFTTRYDLDDQRYQFFEQAGIPMRSVWKMRFLLALPQYALLVVVWLAMCAKSGIPVVPESWHPQSYGQDFVVVTRSSLFLVVMFAGILTLFVNQVIAAHIHRAVLAWSISFLSASSFIVLCFLWFCQFGKVTLWMSGSLVAMIAIVWSMRQANKLFSDRLSGLDRSACLGCAALLPVGMFAVQYWHWLATGPEPPRDAFVPVVLTDKQAYQLHESGHVFVRPDFGDKEQRLLDVLDFQPSELENQPTLLVDQIFGVYTNEERKRLVDLVLRTQDEGLASAPTLGLEGELSRAEELARWNDRNDHGRGLMLAIERLYREGEYLKTPSERLRFCQGAVAVTRFSERYDILLGSYAPSSVAYQLLWEWCREKDRTPAELQEVLQFLQQYDYDWSDVELSVAAFSALRRIAKYSDYPVYDSDYELEWIRKLPGYEARYRAWHQFAFVNAMKNRPEQYRRATSSIQAGKLDVSPWESIAEKNRWYESERKDIAQYASGFFQIGAHSPSFFTAQQDVDRWALRVLEYRATVLRVAIRLYQLRHDNELPGLLDNLVDDGILETLPVDPYSGNAFVYRSVTPWSAHALVKNETAEKGDYAWKPVRSGEQILWSPGPNLIAQKRTAFSDMANSFSRSFGHSQDASARDWLYQFRYERWESQLIMTEDRALALGTSWSLNSNERFPRVEITY